MTGSQPGPIVVQGNSLGAGSGESAPCDQAKRRKPYESRCRIGVVVSKTLGIILIVVGLFCLVWGGFTYTTREKIVDIGPIHATREKTHDVPLPPIMGAVALIGGVVLLVAGRKG